MEANDILHKLQEPFHPKDIEWRVGATTQDKSKGIALAYVTNRAIQNRLDSIFGPFGWKNEYREWKGSSQLCGLSIKFEGEWITKWDGADDSDHEAIKGGLSDAMKRAGYQWGIGRYLYNLENVWVPIKQQGKSYVLIQEPRLPDWALPDGFTYSDKGGGIATQTDNHPVEHPVEEIRRESKFNVVMSKWQVLSGTKEKEKAKQEFDEWLKKKNMDIDTLTEQQLTEIEQLLTKRLMERKNKKKGA